MSLHFFRVTCLEVIRAHVQVGTFSWAAPEVLLGKPCTEKVDIYSYGVLLWELSAGEAPPGRNLRPLRSALCPLNPTPTDSMAALSQGHLRGAINAHHSVLCIHQYIHFSELCIHLDSEITCRGDGPEVLPGARSLKLDMLGMLVPYSKQGPGSKIFASALSV